MDDVSTAQSSWRHWRNQVRPSW